MDTDYIDYGALIDDAMHVIVKRALELVVERGLPGNHHFFISFLTFHPGVVLSEKLRQKYPEEMTVVLQYQFEELQVTDKRFSVVLSFDGVKERVVVPFSALTAFADPSVKFGLQFRHIDEEDDDDDMGEFISEGADNTPSGTGKKSHTPITEDGNNVVTLDAFRKNPPKKPK